MGLFAFLAFVDSLVATPQSLEKKKSALPAAGVFNELYGIFLRKNTAACSAVHLSTRMRGKMDVAGAIEHLGKAKALDWQKGKSGVLLKAALRYGASLGVIGCMLENGASPYLPFVPKKDGADTKAKIHFFLSSFALHRHTDPALCFYFTPKIRAFLFPNGLKQALSVFSDLQKFLGNKERNETNKLLIVADLLRAWAMEESYDLSAYDLPVANVVETTKASKAKEQCAQHIAKNNGVDLTDKLSDGKTLQEIFDFLHEQGELVTPRISTKGTIEPISLLRLAIKRNAKHPVFEYLLKHGAPITFTGNGKVLLHILWDAMSGPATFATLGLFFIPELRALLFPHGIAQAWDLFTTYKYKIVGRSQINKAKKAKELLQAWQDEEDAKAFSIAQQIPFEEQSGALLPDDDLEQEEAEAPQPMELEKEADAEPVDWDDCFNEVCAYLVAKENKAVIAKVLTENEAFLDAMITKKRTW